MRFPSLPDTAPLSAVFAAFPATIPALTGYIEAVMRAPGTLDIAERELIAAYVSAGNACTFCYGSHVIYAEAFGIEKGLIEALVADLESAPLAPRMKTLLGYVARLQHPPARYKQTDLDAVLDAGWPEAAVFEAVQVAALFHMMNRIVEGTGVTFDPLTNRAAHPASRLGNRAREHSFVKTAE
ncbi:MAG: carboxymuconolactone decarboxylase family protein [Rhodobacteraceae bacterium]|nr:carboxymuconolactone decarboxylase family protein [Paracoccaceae bacterium]